MAEFDRAGGNKRGVVTPASVNYICASVGIPVA